MLSSLKMIPLLWMEPEVLNKLKKDVNKFKINLILLNLNMIKKNYKKDQLNSKEVLVLLKLEELVKQKLEKSKIESKMPYVLLEPLLMKVSLLEVDVLYYIPLKSQITLKLKTLINKLVSILLKKLYKFLAEPSLKTQVMKEPLLLVDFLNKIMNLWDMMPRTVNI